MTMMGHCTPNMTSLVTVPPYTIVFFSSVSICWCNVILQNCALEIQTHWRRACNALWCYRCTCGKAAWRRAHGYRVIGADKVFSNVVQNLWKIDEIKKWNETERDIIMESARSRLVCGTCGFCGGFPQISSNVLKGRFTWRFFDAYFWCLFLCVKCVFYTSKYTSKSV